MFGNLAPQAPDKILALMGEFRADTRQGKIDLGVGVYKDPTGLTPVMRAVKDAERRIWESETTKSYTALSGEPAFLSALSRMVMGEALDDSRTAALSSTDTGACGPPMAVRTQPGCIATQITLPSSWMDASRSTELTAALDAR